MSRLFIVVLAAAALALPHGAASQDGAEHLFYYVDTDGAWESLRANIDQIGVIAPSALQVDEDGVVWGQIDPRVMALAEEHGVPVKPLILNPGFDQEMLSGLLSDADARRRAVESMVRLCLEHGFAGIQFDFENIRITDRDRYTQFYREAAEALRAEGLGISMAVVHRPHDEPGPTRYHKWLFKNWRAGYDLEAIAEIGDFISLMSYSQHTRRTPPGPQAGIPWQTEVVEYFLRFMPPEKLSLGIPLQNQHWYTSQEDDIEPEKARSYSRQLSHAHATGLAERHGAEIRWLPDQRVPYTFFSNGGTFEWIFFEDERSFRAKLELMDAYGLRGFSAWVLGPEDPGIWRALRERSAAIRQE
jgi:spore germination protein